MSRSRNQGAAVGPLLWAFALAAVLLSVSFSAANATGAHAQQGPITVGEKIIFDECTIVSAKVTKSDAAFTSVFWKFGPEVNLGFTNQQPDKSFEIGQIPAQQELILGIKVNEIPENIFQTGPGDRNPDGKVHAQILGLPIQTGTTVGFEDLKEGDPFADWDYDDAMLELTTRPCPPPPPPTQVALQVQIDPASTGTGGIAGGGTYDFGFVANAAASPAAGSTFGGWSGDCNGTDNNFAVVMNGNKLCVALFLADPVEPTPEPTPEPTAVPLPNVVSIDNTLTSLNPARVGETVTFRVDVGLEVPAANVADVQYTFDDSELGYQGASWNGVELNQCSLSGAGVIDCAFGTVSADFAFDLNFEALAVADDSTTNASLESDPDGAGPEAAISAGPAAADVDIIAIAGGIPDTGDGSVTESGAGSFPLYALLGVTVLATVAGVARQRGAARS